MHHLACETRSDLVTELTAALSSLEKIAWVRLSDDIARFTVIPEMVSLVSAYDPFPPPPTVPKPSHAGFPSSCYMLC